MIAICPTCHDAVHEGKLKLDDAQLYSWKAIRREIGTIRGQVYVEPARGARILLGSLCVATSGTAVVFALSSCNRLKLRVVESDLLFLDLAISDLSGKEVLRLCDNHYIIASERAGVEFTEAPGTIRLVCPADEAFLPDWALKQLKTSDASIAEGGRVTLLGVSVLKPGLARIEGLWATPERVVVITKQYTTFLHAGAIGPLKLMGEGENSTVVAAGGVVDLALFGFGGPGMLNVGPKA
ncbi:MAG: hypothetical protein L6R30_20150 [Thermoanaerobaculia bacterium]|nr:hypothetical protein [Thermoanaerobaculia bacterium]